MDFSGLTGSRVEATRPRCSAEHVSTVSASGTKKLFCTKKVDAEQADADGLFGKASKHLLSSIFSVQCNHRQTSMVQDC